MKTKLFLGVAAGLLLASCAQKENLGMSRNDIVEYDQTRYLSVALSSPSSTTKGFEDGIAYEHEVKNLVFVFYDKDGKPTGSYVSYSDNDIEDGNLNDQFEDKGGNVTKFWSSIIPINMLQGSNVPASVMCFVNPVEDIATIAAKTLDEVQKIKLTVVRKDKSFPMCNSVYYGKNPLTGKDERMMETPILAGQLHETEKAALEAPALDIYVERYAAKIGLTLSSSAIQEYTVGGHKLKFVPEYWRPNAIDVNLYPVKAFGISGADFEPGNPPAFQDINNAFSGQTWKEWNDPTNFRSYWACSPSYFANEYPRVSDDVNDLEGKTDNYALKYFSYSEIAADNTSIVYDGGFRPDDNDGAGYFYSRETTANIGAIRNVSTGNPAATVASVVIVGHYLADDAADAATFYVDKANDVYYATEAELKAAFMNKQGIVFDDEKGLTPSKNAAYFTVRHPDAGVRGYVDAENKGIAVAGRYVTLQLSDDAVGNVYIYKGGDGEEVVYEKLTAADLTEINKQLWSQVNTVEMFHNGLAFFSIPVRHLGFDAARCYNQEDKKYNWEASQIGDYGIVRNHVYNINVTGISGLATGLRSENQPIVPPKDDVNYYIAARLNILAWNVVNSWDVEL